MLKGKAGAEKNATPATAEPLNAGHREKDPPEQAVGEEPVSAEAEVSVSEGAVRVTAAEAARKLAELHVTCGDLPGMVRRRNPEVKKLLDRVKEDAWIDCSAGINARETSDSPQTRVQEVPSDRNGVRCFVIDSEERRQYEAPRMHLGMPTQEDVPLVGCDAAVTWRQPGHRAYLQCNLGLGSALIPV